MKTTTSITVKSILTAAAVAFLTIENVVAGDVNDADNSNTIVHGLRMPKEQQRQHRRKLFQTQMCTLTLEETWTGSYTPSRRTRRRAAETRSALPPVEFADESGNLTATDGSSLASSDPDGKTTYVITGSGDIEQWTCELSDADAEASGVPFVKVEGLSNEFFAAEGVTSGVTKMVVPTATIENGALKIPQDAEVTLESTFSPSEEERESSTNSKSSKSDRRLRAKTQNVNKNDRRLKSSTGAKKMLVIRVDANDAQTTASENQLVDDVFEDSNCLRSQYMRCSHNKLRFVMASGKGIDRGVMSIRLNKNIRGRERNDVQLDVQAVARDHFGELDWQRKFDHVMICLPPGTAGNWIAYAYVNSWLSIYNDVMCSSVSAQMHEVGHNLGLAHSGQSQTYDDQTSLMGYSYEGDDTPKMCFNPVKSWQLGWYDQQKEEVQPPTSGYYRTNMVGVDDYGKNPNKKIILKISDGYSGQDYYIGYNHADGRNSGTVMGGDQLWVGRRPVGDSYEPSKLLKLLNPTDTYEINNFRNSRNKLIIRLSQKINDGEVVVDIYYEGNAPPLPKADNPCNSNEALFECDLNTDNYGGETSWTVTSGGQTFASGSGYNSRRNYKITKCLPKVNGREYVFQIRDSWGDGICCFEGNGRYDLKVDGKNVKVNGGRFQFYEEVTFQT